MKKCLTVIVKIVALVVFSAGFASAQPMAKAIVDDVCSKCHNLKKVYSANKNLAQWETTLDRMIKKGAKIKPEERDPVLKYLNTLNR